MGKGLTYAQMRSLADIGAADPGKLVIKNKKGHVVQQPVRRWTKGMPQACSSVAINGGEQGSKHHGIRRGFRKS